MNILYETTTEKGIIEKLRIIDIENPVVDAFEEDKKLYLHC